MKKNTLKRNTLILTISGFFVKIIGFFYRVYIAKTIGAEGMGLFQLVLPVYNLVLLGLTAGVGIAVSRLVAEETARGKHRNSNRIAVVAGTAVFVSAIFVVLILLFNLDFVVNYLVGDIRTKSALYWLLPSIPFIAGITALKGYFYGKQEMMPNAISQVVEQAVKLVVIYVISDQFIYGDFERKCLFATLGLVAGEIANVLVVYAAFLSRRMKKSADTGMKLMRKRDIGKSILKISLPITANRLILSFMGTVEFLLIPQRLEIFGLTSKEALVEYGKLTGMASPIISFPSMLTAALAIALVPAIAESVTRKRIFAANRQISRSIRVTLVLGFLFTSLFISYCNEISNIVYPGQNVGRMLYLLSFTGVFFYLQQTLLGILNGLGKETETLKHSMLSSVIRLSFVWFAIPIFGLEAYIAAIVISNFASAALNIRTTVKTTGMAIEIGDWLIKPLIACVSGIIIAPAVKMLTLSVVVSPVPVLFISAGITGMLMIVMLILLGVFDLKDIRHMLPLHIDKFRKL
jgi:stage V sporulation protein B